MRPSSDLHTARCLLDPSDESDGRRPRGLGSDTWTDGPCQLMVHGWRDARVILCGASETDRGSLVSGGSVPSGPLSRRSLSPPVCRRPTGRPTDPCSAAPDHYLRGVPSLRCDGPGRGPLGTLRPPGVRPGGGRKKSRTGQTPPEFHLGGGTLGV